MYELIRGGGGQGRGMKVTPIFEAWVEIRELEDVKGEDVVKFEWEVEKGMEGISSSASLNLWSSEYPSVR